MSDHKPEPIVQRLEACITQAWQQQAWWLWLLWPLSAIYALITAARRLGYRRGWVAQYRAPIPVLVIGNISVGGSGKTPLIMTLVQTLQQQGIRVGVVSRGYGGDKDNMPALVNLDSVPSHVGDEPCLIVQATQVPMAVAAQRADAITCLLQAQPMLQMIISDDGLQHYRMARDIEWIVVDRARGWGNKQLLPAGFLREPLRRLRHATVVEHIAYNDQSVALANATQSSKVISTLTMTLVPSALQPLLGCQLQPVPKLPQPPDRVHAVSGIGYPQRFFSSLQQLGYRVMAHPKPDHHHYQLSELLQYTDAPIVVTSKDAVKLRALLEQIGGTDNASPDIKACLQRCFVLPVVAKLSEACHTRLQRQLSAVGVHSDIP